MALWTWSVGTELFTYTDEELLSKTIFKVASGLYPGVTNSISDSSALGNSQINATTLDVFNLQISGSTQSALVVKNKYLNKYYRSVDGISWITFTP